MYVCIFLQKYHLMQNGTFSVIVQYLFKISVLQHWFYGYCNRFSSSEISELITENHVFLQNTRLSRPAHPYVVDWPVNSTIPYGQNSFFSRTIRIWNSLRKDLIFWLSRHKKSINYRKINTNNRK